MESIVTMVGWCCTCTCTSTCTWHEGYRGSLGQRIASSTRHWLATEAVSCIMNHGLNHRTKRDIMTIH